MSETITEKKGFKIETSALRAYTMFGALIIIWLFFHWQTDGIFLTPRNLSNLMLQTSVTGIIAVGMLMVIVSGNIDLSVGSLFGLAGGVAAIVLTNWGYRLAVGDFGGNCRLRRHRSFSGFSDGLSLIFPRLL